MENQTQIPSSSYENQNWTSINTILVVFYSLISVLGTVGNGLVIFITGFRMKKTVHTIWILNLALADFIFCFFLPFNIAYRALGSNWPFGPIMCKFLEALVFLNLLPSIYTIMVISIDRCISVRYPIWAQNHRTPRLAYFVVLGIWILAVMLCVPYSYSRKFLNKTNRSLCFDNFEVIHERKHPWCVVILIRFIFGFTIPFCVIVVCYWAIVVRLKRDHLSQSSRPFKVITAVIVAFLVCWVPFHLFSFLASKVAPGAKNFEVIRTGFILSSCLAYFNSCLNPILYFFMGHNFKGKLRCSLLSALAKAFTEDSNLDNTKTSKSSAELDSHNS